MPDEDENVVCEILGFRCLVMKLPTSETYSYGEVA